LLPVPQGALEAIASGQEFALSVRAASTAGSASGQPPTLRMRFHPMQGSQPSGQQQGQPDRSLQRSGAAAADPGRFPPASPGACRLSAHAEGAEEVRSPMQLYLATIQYSERQQAPLSRAISGATSGGLLGWWVPGNPSGSVGDLTRADSVGDQMSVRLSREISHTLKSQVGAGVPARLPSMHILLVKSEGTCCFPA
jgi:hypothetical protein